MKFEELRNAIKGKEAQERFNIIYNELSSNEVDYDDFLWILKSFGSIERKITLLKRWLDTAPKPQQENFNGIAFFNLLDQDSDFANLDSEKLCELFEISLKCAKDTYLRKGWQIVGFFNNILTTATLDQRQKIISIWQAQDQGNRFTTEEEKKLFEPPKPIEVDPEFEELKQRVAEVEREQKERKDLAKKITQELHDAISTVEDGGARLPDLSVNATDSSSLEQRSGATKNAGATSS